MTTVVLRESLNDGGADMNGSLRATAPQGDSNELVEMFASLWAADAESDSDSIPDIAAYVRRCPNDDNFSATVVRLIETDLERRWKFPRPIPRLTVSDYMALLPITFSRKARVQLVSTEYKVRNRWGDCVLLNDLYEQYKELGPSLAQSLHKAASNIRWPVVSVVVNARMELEARFDRRLSVGRQRSKDPNPWDVITTADEHRFVLCESSDTSISRRQLQAVLQTPKTVLLKNCSSSRTLAIRSQEPLEAGEQRELSLPVFVHLGGSRCLQIRPAEKRVRRKHEDISDLPQE
ncbi:MAG: hypothetical protein R3C59_17850 [Planctomycetaceae bacterium]